LVKVGVGVADITPAVGTPLSGFIARENQPSTHIDCPLYVRVLAVQQGAGIHFLLNYDLLGLGSSSAEHIISALEQEIGPGHFLMTATHTHSGPVMGLLVGETPPAQEYLDLLAQSSVSAARTALGSLQPAHLLWAEVPVPGLTYNRRALLVDGRVSIMPEPNLPVVQRGPLDERLTLLVWQNMRGENIVALAHYACHGVAVLSQGIGSDIPGALAEAIGLQHGAPCLFLQAAAGDVNPTMVTSTWRDMQTWIERALQPLARLTNALQSVGEVDFQVAEAWVDLPYAALPGEAQAQKQLSDLLRIANGNVTSPDLQDAVRAFKNTMNMPPDASLDPQQSRFIALALAVSARRTLAAIEKGGAMPPCKLHLAAWRLGKYVLLFLACEALTTTGLRLRALNPGMVILPVTYLAPLLGYLPDREALRLGGYEVSEAWRFYGHPAPFAEDSEKRVLEAAAILLAGMR
jgi:neutral ceramidase